MGTLSNDVNYDQFCSCRRNRDVNSITKYPDLFNAKIDLIAIIDYFAFKCAKEIFR